MPLAAVKTKFEQSIVQCTHAYWKIRAANAALLHFSASSAWSGLELKFDNLPSLGCVTVPPSQTMQDALVEIQQYVRDGRAVAEHFMTAISHLESFLAAVLMHKSLSTDGTLGVLLKRAEQAFSLPISPEIEALIEIRERRNMLIHHHGFAQQRYLGCCTATSLPSSIRSTALGQQLAIDNEYYAYACDKLLLYSHLFN